METRKLQLTKKKIIGFKRRELNINDCCFSPDNNCDSCNDQTKSWYIAANRHSEKPPIVQDVELPLVETDDDMLSQEPMDVNELSIKEIDKSIRDSTSTQLLDKSLNQLSEPMTTISSSNSSASSPKTPAPSIANDNIDNCCIILDDDEDEDMNQLSETIPKPANQELQKNKRLNEIIRKCIVQTNNKENKTPKRTLLTINAVTKEISHEGDNNVESPRVISTPLLTKRISDEVELLTIQPKPPNNSDAEAFMIFDDNADQIPTNSDKVEATKIPNNIDSECILIDDDDNEDADANQVIPQQEIPTPNRRATIEISDKIEITTVQPKASNNIDSQCILIDDDDNNDNVCTNQEISTSLLTKSSNTFKFTPSNRSISQSSPIACASNQPKLVEYVIRHDNDLIEDENDLTLAELQEKNQKESSTTKSKENEIPCIDLASDDEDADNAVNAVKKKLNNSDGFIDEIDPNKHYDDFWSPWNDQYQPQLNTTNNVIKETASTTTATSHIKNLDSLKKIVGINNCTKGLVFTIEPDNKNASNLNKPTSHIQNDNEINQLNDASSIDTILQIMTTNDDEIVVAQPQFQCQACYEVFEKNSKLHKHLRTSEECIEIINKTTTETYINTKPYECDICNRAFSSVSVIEYHMLRSHSGSLKRKCRLCAKMLPTPKALRRHVKAHLNKKDKFKCTVCNRNLATKQSLVLHMRVHTGEKPYSCQTCSKAFTTTHALISHSRIHTNERPFKCDICHNSFAQYGSLQVHKNTHNAKQFSCEFCSKNFTQQKLLNIHITNHHSSDGKLYQCDICQKALRSYMSLRNHMLRHSNPVTCKICLKTYSSDSNLESHMNRTHNKNDLNQNGSSASINDWMTCEVCNTLLPNVDSMRLHMNLHRHNDIDNDIDLKPFKCTLCIMVFSLESNLQRHMALHKRKQGRPVLLRKCNECNESYPMSQKQFKLHLKSHLTTTDMETDNNIDTDIDVKPFKCKFCIMVFSLETNLNRHIALHKRKPGRPALLKKCNDCNDSFLMSQKEFVLHKKTHHSSTPLSMENLHICKICKRTFSDSNKLIYHEYAHTPKTKDNRYKCDKCNKTVTSIFQLRQHMLNKHTKELRYECKYCKNRFRQYVQMYNHIRRTHKNIIKTYSCKICEKSYTKIELLYIHNQTHKIITDSIKCKFCDYEFQDDKQLAKHMIIHAKDKNRPYLCTICDETFKKLSDLNSHSYLHMDTIRKFKCIICEKLFANDGALANHKKLHIRNTTFDCERCKKTFTTKFGYNNHMLRHNRRRRGHKCDLCPKTFWTKMSLTSHKRRHSDNDAPQLEKLECPVCLKTFRKQRALDQHLHRHVGVK